MIRAGPPTQLPDGSLVGTAAFGGRYNGGVIYEISAAGVYSIVHPLGGWGLYGQADNTFCGCPDQTMNETERLVAALAAHANTAWGKAALYAIANVSVAFVGSRDLSAGATVRDLLLIYRRRLEHIRERGIEVQGMRELVEALAHRPPDELIEVQPFSRQEHNAVAFWSSCGDLIGCVTLRAPDPGVSQRNLDFACGRRESFGILTTVDFYASS